MKRGKQFGDRPTSLPAAAKGGGIERVPEIFITAGGGETPAKQVLSGVEPPAKGNLLLAVTGGESIRAPYLATT